jgi:hypothetical protein
MAGFLRVRRSHLQTPVRHYRHLDTGRRVTHVCVMNIGEHRYYTQVRALITDLETGGARVHCRAVQPSEEVLQTATPEEQDFLAERERGRAARRRRCGDAGWTLLSDSLTYPDTWRIVDLDPLEDTRLFGLDAARAAERVVISSAESGDRSPRKANQSMIASYLAMRVMARASRKAFGWPMTGEHGKVDRRRAAIVLDGLDSTDGDLVVMQSCDNAFLEVEQALADRGLVFERETWHTVGRLPSLPAAIVNLLLGTKPSKRHTRRTMLAPTAR